MPKLDNLIPVFRDIVGETNIVTDTEKLKTFTIDAVVPGMMIAPGTLEETSSVMAAAHQRGLAVIPVGGGTKLSLGGVPRGADILLSTKRMNGYKDYDIANLSIEVECGATLAEVQARLNTDGEGYILPLDSPHSGGATIGGIVATNDNGPRRLLYGGLRDIILGNTAVLANGDIVTAGGKVMKNVASYDLTKLLIGSLGTLGLICSTTFRIYLKPEAEATLFLSFAGLQEAGNFIRRLLPSFYYPAAIELLTTRTISGYKGTATLPGDYLVAIGMEGIVEAVERQIADMTEIGRKEGALGTAAVKEDAHRDFWIAYRDFTETMTKKDPNAVVLKANFAVSRHAEMVAAAEKITKGASLESSFACHAGNGILYAAIPVGPDVQGKAGVIVRAIEELTAEAVKNDGNLVVERAPLTVKEKVSVWGRIGSDIGLMRGLKEKFDPTGIINPGRYVGGI